MKMIIAGSRDFTDYGYVCRAMKEVTNSMLLPVTEEICGMQEGVDLLGKRWADERGIPVKPFYPDWGRYGLSAGPKRNKEMADYADYLVLFWDEVVRGKIGRGSSNMLNTMRRLGKPFKVINYNSYTI